MYRRGRLPLDHYSSAVNTESPYRRLFRQREMSGCCSAYAFDPTEFNELNTFVS